MNATDASASATRANVDGSVGRTPNNIFDNTRAAAAAAIAPTTQIVGVVADVHEAGLDQPAPPVMYIPVAQVPDAMTRFANTVMPMTWLVRGAGDPAAAARRRIPVRGPGR